MISCELERCLPAVGGGPCLASHLVGMAHVAGSKSSPPHAQAPRPSSSLVLYRSVEAAGGIGRVATVTLCMSMLGMSASDASGQWVVKQAHTLVEQRCAQGARAQQDFGFSWTRRWSWP